MTSRLLRVTAPGGLKNLALSETEPAAATPGPGDIRVRLHASSLNYHDYMVCAIEGRAADGRIPMADGAGEVLEVGEGVQGFAVGDNVVSCFFPTWTNAADLPSNNAETPGDGIDGFARSEVTLPASWFTKSPEGWSHEEAATITTAGLTAWRALVVDGGLKAGQTVVTLGVGGVAVYAVQLAKALGARVISLSSSDAKLEKLKALGADEVINYKTTPEWGVKVRELTGGLGADHVVETGGIGSINQSVQAARPGGHVAVIGVMSGFTGDFMLAAVLVRQVRVQGLLVGSPQHQREFVAALNATGLRPVIDRSFDLAELAEAFEYQLEARHFGKICVTI